jgi:hypothetical protein
MQKTIQLYHEDCGYMCNHCSGTGEGMHNGSNCSVCRGRGWVESGPNKLVDFEIEWSEDDLSDLEILDGPTYCEYCDFSFFKSVFEELAYQLRKTK